MAPAPLSVQHVNVNCSSLPRSLLFYRDGLGLTSHSHTNPLPQEGAGFGLPGRVQWDAHLLHDDRGHAASAVDLLEWQSPKPTGRPHREPHRLGFFRLCLTHPDLDALHRELESSGVPCRSGPVETTLHPGATARVFCCEDPDGSVVGLIERAGPVQMHHVQANCRDLERSSDWYQRVLGLESSAGRAETVTEDGRSFGLEGACRHRADFLCVPGAEGSLGIELVEWLEPRPIGEPLVAANHLGLFRMAFMVDSARESCAELDRQGVAHSGPCWLEMGPEIPIDGLFAVFFRDPDGACLELIETPKITGGLAQA